MAEQQPSVGRIVHYTRQRGGEAAKCFAAIVTEIAQAAKMAADDHVVGLFVMTPDAQFSADDVAEGQKTRLDGTWHWPERV